MPQHEWTINLNPQIAAFQHKHESDEKALGASPFFSWAKRCVDSLHYLYDLDRELLEEPRPLGHHPDIVDVAHARWATATAITALDLCAAVLGRVYCPDFDGFGQDLSVGWLKPSSEDERIENRREELSEAAVHWIDDTWADPDYQRVRKARNALIHSILPRHITIAVGAKPRDGRIKLELSDGQRVDVREVIEDARDVATLHVTQFFELLPQL